MELAVILVQALLYADCFFCLDLLSYYSGYPAVRQVLDKAQLNLPYCYFFRIPI